MHTIRMISLAFLAAPLTAAAHPMTFDFKDPKGVNSIEFHTDAPLESISGSGAGITGSVRFDPHAPQRTTGTIVLDAKTLIVPNPLMNSHLHGDGWLNTAKNGEIVFKASSLANVKQDGNTITADVTGSLSLNGTTKDLTVPVTFTYLPGMLEARSNGSMKGDLLVVRSSFEVSRSDFGIKPGEMEDKVSNTIGIRLSLAGMAPR